MPIVGGSLEEAATDFREHLNRVLHLTVTQAPLTVVRSGPSVQLAFRRGGRPIEVSLRTRFGSMWLYLGQTCNSTPIGDGRHRLHTVAYQYTLRADEAGEATFRWEYEKSLAAGKFHCRHHLQGDVALQIGRAAVALNDLHLPTGFVTIEEVLRFCIVDLDVKPLSAEWDMILTDSYEKFKGDFAPRGQL